MFYNKSVPYLYLSGSVRSIGFNRRSGGHGHTGIRKERLNARGTYFDEIKTRVLKASHIVLVELFA